MTKSRRSGPRGPVVFTEEPIVAGPRGRVFGGTVPEGPLPGRLLVLLSRLHRAESAPREPRERTRS